MRNLLAIRTGLPFRTYALLASFAFVLPILVWAVFSYGGYAKPLFLPSPSLVLAALVRTFRDGVLFNDILISLYRVSAGFVLSAVIAVPLGILMGTFVSVEALQEPFVDFVRYMPAAAFIPLIMLYVGIGEWAKILVIFIGTYFQLILMVMENSRGVPLELLNVSYTLGASRWQVLTRVVLPGAMPGIFESLRMTLGWAWTYLVVAELVA
ncbi:MAG: ABC transporter permease, partial [Armatimonadetes bacterium]|nr:ABC transporter permease [Armatimonadota bacterium]